MLLRTRHPLVFFHDLHRDQHRRRLPTGIQDTSIVFLLDIRQDRILILILIIPLLIPLPLHLR